MTDSEFLQAEPKSLTVARLKQGITFFGGVLPQNGRKDDFINAFVQARSAFARKNPTLSQLRDEPKTEKIVLGSPQNVYRQPDGDLTQTAFQITGAFPVNRDQILRDAHQRVVISPGKQLKANVQFEKTPQSIVHHSIDLENFMQSHYQQPAPEQQPNFDVTTNFDRQVKISTFQVDLDATKSVAQSAARMSQPKPTDIPAKSILKGPALQPNPQRQVQFQPLQVSDLHKEAQRAPKPVHKPTRERKLMNTVSLNESAIQKKIQSTFKYILPFVAFVIATLCLISVGRHQLVLPTVTRPVLKLCSYVLPVNVIVESKSLSLIPPTSCTEHAVCNEDNEVTRCEPTYRLQQPLRTHHAANWRLRLVNRLARVNLNLMKLTSLARPVNADTVEHISHTRYYKLARCARAKSDQLQLAAQFAKMEGELLVTYGAEQCTAQKRLKLRTNITNQLEADTNRWRCLEDIRQFSALKQEIKQQITTKVLNKSSDIADYIPHTLEFRSNDDCTTKIQAQSTDNVTRGFWCSFRIFTAENARAVLSSFAYTIIGAVVVIYAKIKISSHGIVKECHRNVKSYLQIIKEQEQSVGSSMAAFAVRADALKDRFIGDRFAAETLWREVEKRLDQDPQIDKQWVRGKGGEAVTAYCYNDGIIRLKKGRSTREESQDISEHSISY